MIRNLNKIVGLALVLTSFSLQVNAQKIEQMRSVGDFTGIKVGDMFKVKLKQAENNSVSINTEESKQSTIKTEVNNGVLSIISDGKDDIDATITVGVKALNSIKITGMADVKSENRLNCNQLTIESNGAGGIDLDINAKEIISDISGIGDVMLTGIANLHTSKVSGTGSLRASNLETEKSVVKVSGVGDAKVNAKQTIDADVSGAGSVIYKGNPAERIINISGIGSVRESQNGTGDETASDTTKFKFGNKKYIIIGDENIEAKDTQRTTKHTFKHWSGYELGINGLLDYKNSLDAPTNGTFMELDYPKSYQFGLNLFEKDFHIYKNYVNIIMGLGFDFNHYALRNNVTLNGSTDFLAVSIDSIEYKKNTINVSYLKVPLLLEFNTSSNPDKNFHIAVGGEFAYRIHSVAKQKWETDDKRYKMKQRDDFNLEPFRYSATARIGYNNVTIFANYGLNRLFKKDKGPQVYPFSLGVCIAMK